MKHGKEEGEGFIEITLKGYHVDANYEDRKINGSKHGKTTSRRRGKFSCRLCTESTYLNIIKWSSEKSLDINVRSINNKTENAQPCMETVRK
ncbi:hypothetical protein GCK32_001945 [Trichostrongylus colubriformis]|uniref:Uncharacterized protein n=1 Tax=Trichostrongylus colubriformis TaxID=6319 RepID=A0AAN8G1P5_TRICO